MDRVTELIKELDTMIRNNEKGTKSELLVKAKCTEIAAMLEDLDSFEVSDEAFDGLCKESKALMIGGFIGFLSGMIQ
jgi:hypothetical protein